MKAHGLRMQATDQHKAEMQSKGRDEAGVRPHQVGNRILAGQ
jgi:hypothetical protein